MKILTYVLLVLTLMTLSFLAGRAIGNRRGFDEGYQSACNEIYSRTIRDVEENKKHIYETSNGELTIAGAGYEGVSKVWENGLEERSEE